MVTHGLEYGILDKNVEGDNVGCEDPLYAENIKYAFWFIVAVVATNLEYSVMTLIEEKGVFVDEYIP